MFSFIEPLNLSVLLNLIGRLISPTVGYREEEIACSVMLFRFLKDPPHRLNRSEPLESVLDAIN